MALFGNLFGSRKESKAAKEKETWEKELSFMVAIPKNEEDIADFEHLAERLKSSGVLTKKDSKINEMLWLKICSVEYE